MKRIITITVLFFFSLYPQTQPLYTIVKEVKMMVEKNGGNIRVDTEGKNIQIEVYNGKIGALFVKIWHKDHIFSRDSIDFIVDRGFDGIIDFATNPSKKIELQKGDSNKRVRVYFYELYKKTLTEILEKRKLAKRGLQALER